MTRGVAEGKEKHQDSRSWSSVVEDKVNPKPEKMRASGKISDKE